MSKKKLVIILSAVVVIIIIGVILGILLLNDEDVPKEIKGDKVNTYTAYVSINPLIKLEFEEKCIITKGTNDDGEVQENMTCDDPIVTDYVLVNEDAQNIYKDVDFSNTGGALSDVLVLIAQTARDNNVVFDTVDIYSDYSTINEYINQHKEVTTTWTFSINIVNKEDIEDVGSDLEGEVKNFTVTFNSNGGSRVASQSIIEGGKVTIPTNPTRNGYTFVEWQLDGQKYDFDNVVEDNIELEAIWKKNSTPVDVDPEPEPEPTPDLEPTPTYDFNLNDNIFYYEYDINLIKQPSQSCLTSLKNAGYGFSKGGIVNLDDPNLYLSANIIYPMSFVNDEETGEDLLFSDYDLKVISSCVPTFSQSELNYLSSLAGVKNAGIVGSVEQIRGFWVVVFSEYEYEKKLTTFRPLEPPAGYMQFDGTGPSPDGLLLLDEAACEEFNLSCGRW